MLLAWGQGGATATTKSGDFRGPHLGLGETPGTVPTATLPRRAEALSSIPSWEAGGSLEERLEPFKDIHKLRDPHTQGCLQFRITCMRASD